MKFAIQVHGSPQAGECGDSAYQFIRAALAQGHEIVCVFFYHEGVYQSVRQDPSQEGGVSFAANWSELAEREGFVLDVCISAAQRRGVAPEGSDPGLGLASGFRLSGLGVWVDACLKADRVLIFRE
ncbi:sulfurtransferase complex subunit TusD [Methyloterricola oryzae]|uniref:sulfurtransferase complex subunit TusD n=1 Tax=Methyloterricola oryzae TaxID=1495050 RepID=UPI0005EAE760|nr:sulfurtransferase complex subunit TusD [Methyloterricola oryzae]